MASMWVVVTLECALVLELELGMPVKVNVKDAAAEPVEECSVMRDVGIACRRFTLGFVEAGWVAVVTAVSSFEVGGGFVKDSEENEPERLGVVLAAMFCSEALRWDCGCDSSSDGGSSGVGRSERGRFPRTVLRRKGTVGGGETGEGYIEGSFSFEAEASSSTSVSELSVVS